jgi:Ran GTPase-activating protein (RanGAP) involved in mRNA processing and transport
MTSLDISDNKIGTGYRGYTDGSQALATAVKSTSNLKELNISSNAFTADDAKILADGISGNGALSVLDLSSNQLTRGAFNGHSYDTDMTGL